MAKIVHISNISKRPIKIAIAEDARSTIFTAHGVITISSGKTISVEEKRINLSVLENLRKLGFLKYGSSVTVSIVSTPEAPEEEALNLGFTYAIGGGPTSMSPDDIISGLGPVEFNSSAIVVTNNGVNPVDVEAATISPGSDGSISGFVPSTINNGGTNSFNILWGAASAFDEDLTITVNGTNFIFTFQGTIQGGGS